MKRIVLCCDGTWNTPTQGIPTNVTKTARAVLPAAPDGTAQVVFYDAGVGTEGRLLSRFSGGVFGEALTKNVADAYRFLVHNYEDGDEIYLFGFSRGAYTARSTVGLLCNVGLLRKMHADRFPEAMAMYRRRDVPPDSYEAERFRANYSRGVPPVEFMGVWDTVGPLGIPWRRGLLTVFPFLAAPIWPREDLDFHDVTLSGIVKHGYHALAIDDTRKPFEPSLWKAPKQGQVIEQAWFAGVHTDIGGGREDSGLSDEAFVWMMEKARARGLAFDGEYVSKWVRPDPLGTLHDNGAWDWFDFLNEPRRIGRASEASEALHDGVRARLGEKRLAYAPANVLAYLQQHEAGETGRQQETGETGGSVGDRPDG